MNQKLLKISALLLGLSGLIILMVVLVPIAVYVATSRQKFPELLSPIPKEKETSLLAGLDYSKASNWFVGGVGKKEFSPINISFYTISIPALGIEKATTAIGGEDLSKNLIHYPGTALPGKIGNSVIFGHSVLPIFFNPEDYLAIFSTLPTLDKGDEIHIDYDGVSYKYIVTEMFEVNPSDIQVLDQDWRSSNLTLVTCTPPGDPRKPKRLIVRAKIVPADYANAKTGS